MPKLQAIKAFRYTASDSGDISSYIAPPYDVLDEGPKQSLLSKNPENIVKIDLPVTPPKTVGPAEAYQQAAEVYKQWIADDVLKQDGQPAIYAYEQAYDLAGQTIKRRGFFTGLGVESFGRENGGIHRHELTIKSGTDDRTLLMNATGAQLSPVFGMFSDAQNKVMPILDSVFQTTPNFTGTTSHDNVEHRVWIVTDENIINLMTEALDTTDVFIADGHHRYTTALNYSKANPESENATNCLFVLVPIEDPGMLVRATHRVIRGLSDFNMKKFEELIAADDRLTLRATNHGGDGIPVLADELPEYKSHAMGIYDPEKGKTYILSFNEDPLVSDLPDKPEVWRQLDVAILQEVVIDRILKPNFGGDAIHNSYPHEFEAFVRDCHDEPNRLGFLMQPTPLKAVCDVSLAGEVMPPKSTFFFPKLATGLIINPLS